MVFSRKGNCNQKVRCRKPLAKEIYRIWLLGIVGIIEADFAKFVDKFIGAKTRRTDPNYGNLAKVCKVFDKINSFIIKGLAGIYKIFVDFLA